jgi:ribose transport system substrate-binding protein
VKHTLLIEMTLRSRSLTLFAALACVGLLAGCATNRTAQDESRDKNSASAVRKKFYWIQPVKGHPVHQLTQIAFREGCKSLGYDYEILGTDGADIGGTIGLAEQSLARRDVAGLAIWTGNPAYNSFIEKAGKAGIPVILPHFPAPEGSIPGASGIISCDPKEYSKEAADEIGKAIQGKGTVAITQGSFNSNENMVAETFERQLHEAYPQLKVLRPLEEGFDLPGAIGKAVSVLQANEDLVGALSTTGGGPVTWANAQKETGRRIVIIGMDYTRLNLDLIKSGEVHAVVAQPLWEESFGAAELLAKVVRGEKIPWWTKLPAPLITKDKLDPYYELLKKVENAIN